MTQPDLIPPATSLTRAFADLARDLTDGDVPRISTMRNYRFAIVPYPPADEFALRRHVAELTATLTAKSWLVLSLSLQRLFLERVRHLPGDFATRLIARERRLTDPQRALNLLKEKLAPELEGPTGLAADVAREIAAFAAAHPDDTERTLVILGRAGALYPLIRSSALLRHLDGRTGNIPVILLYPGSRRGESGLSFMDELPPDRDYRPRIYG